LPSPFTVAAGLAGTACRRRVLSVTDVATQDVVDCWDWQEM